MKRILLRVGIVATLVIGILLVLTAALLCLLGAPAFHSTVAGNTSLLLSQSVEEAERLEGNFVFAALGVSVLVLGILNTIQGIMGIHGLRSGRYDRYIFMCGVVAFSMLFSSLVSFQLDWAPAIIAFNLALAVLAYLEQHSQAKEGAAEPRSAGSVSVANDEAAQTTADKSAQA
jgi:arginine exporter protein ArgO